MNLSFCPRSQLVQWLNDGYRLILGHEYAPGDYAILMVKPDEPEALSARRIGIIALQFQKPRNTRSNKSCGASSRQWQRFHKDREYA